MNPASLIRRYLFGYFQNVRSCFFFLLFFVPAELVILISGGIICAPAAVASDANPLIAVPLVGLAVLVTLVWLPFYCAIVGRLQLTTEFDLTPTVKKQDRIPHAVSSIRNATYDWALWERGFGHLLYSIVTVVFFCLVVGWPALLPLSWFEDYRWIHFLLIVLWYPIPAKLFGELRIRCGLLSSNLQPIKEVDSA